MKRSRMIRAMLEKLQQHPDTPHHVGHQRVAMHVLRMASALESLEYLAITRNPAETEATHARRVAAAAEKLEARVASIREEIDNDVRGYVTKLDEVITEQAGLKPNEFASEIRQAVRAMDSEARLKVLHQAVESGDAATVAALTGAPGVVTGIGPEVSSRMLEGYRATHAPEASAAADSLMDVYSGALSAAYETTQAAKAAYDPKFIAEIQQQEAAAVKAAADFDAALA